MDENIFWPLEYEKAGIVYVLDISTRKALWTVYEKESRNHTSFGFDPATALRNAGLSIFDRKNKE